MRTRKYQPREKDTSVNVERLKAESLAPVELSDEGYSWYASGNDDLTTWSGQAAPDWAAGARTLYAMAGWAYGLGLRYEGDEDRIKQWTGTAPNSAAGADQRRLGGLYAKYATCRRWWSSWQAEHMDGTPKDSMVLLDTKSCHDPLCPLCMRLRAHKREIAYGRAWEDLQKKKKSRDGTEYKLLQVVVDIGRNCQGDELRDQLDRLIKGTQRFIRWMDETKGVIAHVPASWVWGTETQRSDSPLWMLGTEITRHNAPDGLQGTYHPHVHLIVAVYSSHIKTFMLHNGCISTSWRKSAGISRPEMIRKWREIMGDPNINNLYMGKVDNPHQALKYAVKGSIGKVDDKTGDAALYVEGDDYDSYNMDTLSTIHDAIVEYRHGQRNRSRQMFRASLAWAHLATLKAQELKISLDDTDADDTVLQTGQGRIVRGRQRKGRLEAVSVDAALTTLEEARAQIRLEQSLRYMKTR